MSTIYYDFAIKRSQFLIIRLLSKSIYTKNHEELKANIPI